MTSNSSNLCRIDVLEQVATSCYAIAPEESVSGGSITMGADVAGPDFAKHELIPAIAQDDASGVVLMMAWMNREAWEETLRTGRVCYFSRSRQKLWRKGEESGNVQELRAVYFDCDADTILVKVHQVGGAACHEGYQSCFFRRVDPASGAVSVEGEREFDPAEVYGKSR